LRRGRRAVSLATDCRVQIIQKTSGSISSSVISCSGEPPVRSVYLQASLAQPLDTSLPWPGPPRTQAISRSGRKSFAGSSVQKRLFFPTWWMAASKVSWAERFLVIGVAVVGGVGAAVLGHRLLGPFLLLPGLPIVLTTWTFGLIVARKWPARWRGLALISTVTLTWGAFLLIRAEGMGGDGQLALRWRWTRTAEELYLDTPEGQGKSAGQPRATKRLKLRPGDWPGFRGLRRDGTLHHVRIATDWDTAPPRLL
jgi:hypothetical protein